MASCTDSRVTLSGNRKMALPSPEKLSFSLTTARRRPGGARRTGHVGLAEHLAAPRLGAEIVQLGIEPVQRDVEQHRQLALERGRVEDGQIGRFGVGNGLADALDQPGTLQDLLGQRARRAVVGAQHRQARSGVTGRYASQQVQVVIEDQRMHRLRRDVGHVRARVAQADQQKQQALLVERGAIELGQLLLIERERRHHDRRRRQILLGADHVPHLVQARLQPIESGQLLLAGELVGERRSRNHDEAPPEAGATRRSAICRSR
jgi:hypothetical protein